MVAIVCTIGRPRPPGLLLLVPLILLLWACGGGPPDSSPREPARAGVADSRTGAAASAVLIVVDPLHLPAEASATAIDALPLLPASGTAPFPLHAAREVLASYGMALGQWVEREPADALALFRDQDSWYGDGQWCVRATRRDRLLSGRVLLRHAFFYPPTPPSPPVVPSATDGEQLRREMCRLGMIWVETEEEDSARAATLLDSTRAAISTRLGAPRAGAEVSFWASSLWSGTTQWRTDSVTYVTAWGPTRGQVSSPDEI